MTIWSGCAMRPCSSAAPRPAPIAPARRWISSRQEIRRLADEGPTDDELAKAKAYLKGSYALNLDTSSKIASQLVQIQIDELGIDYISRRNALIDAVTLADARRVAKRLLGGGLLTTVVGRPQG